MAQAKKAAASTSSGKVNQRDCLVFSSNLYHFAMSHPAIRNFLPPPMPEEKEPLFTENIGKAVLILWCQQQPEFRMYDQFNLRWLAGPNMQEHLRSLCKDIFEVHKNVFRAVIYMSAFLMDTHLFLFQRGYEEALKRLPALWTDIFQTHYAHKFFLKGGWFELKTYARDGSKKYDSELKGFSLQPKFNMYVMTNSQYKKVDRTKEFRLFIVQKSLELLKTIRGRILRKERILPAAIAEVTALSTVINKIVNVCHDLDFGIDDVDVLNERLRNHIHVFCIRFYCDGEFTSFVNKMRYDPRDCQGIPDPNAPSEESTEPLSFTEEELKVINLHWEHAIAPLRRDLRLVMPPGTDDSSDCNIDSMLNDDYTRELLKKIGGLRVGADSPSNIDMNAVLDELNKSGVFVAGVPDQMGESKMLEERIKVLEATAKSSGQTPPIAKEKSPGQTPPKAKSKSLSQTPPTAGPSSGQPVIASEGARPKCTLSSSSESTPGGESSKSTLESSAEDPSVEERMKDLGISSQTQKHSKTTSSKSTGRKRKGSRR